MRVLLIGASGFIGSAIGASLLADGHDVHCLGRDIAYGRALLPGGTWHAADLRGMTEPERWLPLLGGIDAVVNASGALQTGLRDDVPAVQLDAVVALARAAAQAGVRHFVQISAAGADTRAGTDFMATKGAADEALRQICTASAMACTVLRPGLVIGRNCYGGTELLRAAAALPAIAPHIASAGPIQCVALSDVLAAVKSALAQPSTGYATFDLVEPHGHSLGEIIAAHRTWLGLPEASVRIPVPRAAMAVLAACADALGWLGWRSPLRSNAMRALTAGVSGRSGDAATILGRPAMDLRQTLEAIGGAGRADRLHARMVWLAPLVIGTLIALWIGSGLIGLAHTAEAQAILSRQGMAPGAARMLVLAGSVADLAIGLAMASRTLLPLALKAGLVVAACYVAGAAIVAPQLWLDPLGPMLKVLPVMALTAVLLATAEPR